MQPTLTVTVPAAGMIYLNGRFAGEARPDMPLLTPVAPFGAVYLEYRPLEPGFGAMTRKFVFSGGAPLADSLPEGVFAILWPGNIAELELSPEENPETCLERFTLEGLPCRILRGRDGSIELGNHSWRFPLDGQIPELRRLGRFAVLTGQCEFDRYALILTADFSRELGFLRADRIDFESETVLRALTDRHDVAGHGVQERWQIGDAGLELLESESVWVDGKPRAPATPEETARAAVEAALMGFFDEAEEALSPALRARHPLDAISDLCDLCLPMKYAPPGGQPAIGLLRAESDRFARVQIMTYRAEFFGGRWRLTELNANV